MEQRSAKANKVHKHHPLEEVLDRVIFILQSVFTAVCALFLVAWTYSPFREWLITRKVVADKADVTTDAVAVAIALILAVLIRLQKRMGRLLSQIRFLIPQFDDIIDRGIGAIYPYLYDSIREAYTDRERSLEVLGLNLYTAWPHIRDWIQNDEMRKWKITLYCVDPLFMEGERSNFPIQWIHHAQTQIEDISMFKEAHEVELANAGINLELHPYKNFPAMHGFRLGSGELFFSTIQWDPITQKLTDPYNFYERVRPNDRSRRANVHRTMFDNWIKKAAITSASSADLASNSEHENDHAVRRR